MTGSAQPPHMTPRAYKHLRRMERELDWTPTPTPDEARPAVVPGRGYDCPQCGIFEVAKAGAVVPENRNCYRCGSHVQPRDFPPLKYPHGYPWWAERLAAAYAVLGLGGILVLGALGGVGCAWACTALRLVSPDNVPAGLAFGFGGAMAGLLAGLAVLLVSGRRHRVL